jgi:uncharacterized protein YkvS
MFTAGLCYHNIKGGIGRQTIGIFIAGLLLCIFFIIILVIGIYIAILIAKVLEVVNFHLGLSGVILIICGTIGVSFKLVELIIFEKPNDFQWPKKIIKDKESADKED